jgi:hypothetical protein
MTHTSKRKGNFLVAYDSEGNSKGKINIHTERFIGDTNVLIFLNQELKTKYPRPKISAIEKMRTMVAWFDMHSEYFNEKFKTVNQLEKIFDFSNEKGYEFLDDEYVYSNLTEEERFELFRFLDKVKKTTK